MFPLFLVAKWCDTAISMKFLSSGYFAKNRFATIFGSYVEYLHKSQKHIYLVHFKKLFSC